MLAAELSQNSIQILRERYLLKDRNGKVSERPEQMFRRVARFVASDERAGRGVYEREFYNMMSNLEFLPNSPTLMNAGTAINQLSACFVLPVEDSLESIFDAIKQGAIIHHTGGGTGFSFSKLRSRGDVVSSTSGVASGPVSFMRVFNCATDVIMQGGRRRGANMGLLLVHHPDILDFISCKTEQGELSNFNISVAVTDRFMSALSRNGNIDLINPRNNKVVKKVRARRIFNSIVDHAWKNGEPGIVFIDRVNADNPTPKLGDIEAINPCAEQPLLPYESCNLGSINLSRFVRDGKVDFNHLRNTVHLAVRLLDNIINLNRYPLPEIDKMTKANRKIGLGVMGFADMLIQLGIAYDSEDAVKTADKVMGFIHSESKNASELLAKQKGAFPNLRKSKLKRKLRNATTTTIAPTGTISMIADTSSGIEPLFAVAYERCAAGENIKVIDPLFEAELKRRNIYSKKLIEHVMRHGSLKGMRKIPRDMRRVFVTAHDIKPEWHVRIQAAFQRHVDNAISKTVNLPNSASKKQVEKVFLLAYKMGCKGVTVYRDMSRNDQIMRVGRRDRGSGKCKMCR